MGVAMRKVMSWAVVLAMFSSPAFASENISYNYDVLGRLVAVSRSGGPASGVQSAISYDNSDNRINYTVTGAASTFSVSDASATEGGVLIFTVTRTGPATGNVTVNYATSDGSATAGPDYTATSGTLTFAPTDTSKTISVSTIDDTAVEGNETLTVSLSNPSGGALLARAAGTGTIVDNDATVTLSIGNASTVTEGGALIYTVTKSAPTNASVSVNYATADGTGAAGSDYVATSGTLTFAPSEMSKTISVGTVDDSTPEPAKTVLVNLSGATSGAVIGNAQGAGTVNDNDTTPITFSVSNAATVTEGGTLVFTVTRSGATYLTTSVNYSTADGSATAGSDYFATSGTLTFGPSDTSKTVGVGTIDDAFPEPAESMLLNLSGPNGGSISVGQASGTINDNDPAPISALNPTYNVKSIQVMTIPITALASLNGRPGRISSFSPASGNGSAVISSDGSSVSFTAQTVPTGPACDTITRTATVPFTIQDQSDGVVTSGSVTFNVTGPRGPTPRGGCP